MDKNLEKVGSRIQETRKKLGISQADFADKLGISVPHLSNIENGKKTAGLDIFIDIAKQLDVSADWLLDIKPTSLENITTAKILELFEGCTDYEIETMLETAKLMKEALRGKK